MYFSQIVPVALFFSLLDTSSARCMIRWQVYESRMTQNPQFPSRPTFEPPTLSKSQIPTLMTWRARLTYRICGIYYIAFNLTMRNNRKIKSLHNFVQIHNTLFLTSSVIIFLNNLPFPRVIHCCCNRSFQYKWLRKCAELVYGKAVDGGFCRFCAFFARRKSKLSAHVNKPFAICVKVTHSLCT